MLVVDYLQLMTGAAKKGDNRVQEVSEITTGLKALAKELNVPIIALSQLSRAVEKRDDKRPQLSDLRESGSIEQDADIVMFVYREEYYVERTKPAEGTTEFQDWMAKMQIVSGKAEVIIGKQRHGPIGTVQLQFDGNVTRFSDLARDAIHAGAVGVSASGSAGFVSARPKAPIPSSARAVLTVDLMALRANWARLNQASGRAECAGVIKADAYGLGLAPIARALTNEGCKTFFVATVDEGRAAREVQPGATIYVLDGLLPGAEAHYAGFDLRPVLSSLPEVRDWAAYCRARGHRLAGRHPHRHRASTGSACPSARSSSWRRSRSCCRPSRRRW